MECVECRGSGVTKRGVCPKCPAGQRFLERSDGGIRLALQPEFAKRFAAEPRRVNDVPANVAAMTPEVRAEYERARVKLGLAEQGELADREAAPPAGRSSAEVATVEPAADFPTGDAVVVRKLRASDDAVVLQGQLRDATEANATLRLAAERGRMAEAAALELQRQNDELRKQLELANLPQPKPTE